MKKLMILAPMVLLAGCESIGGPGVSEYYECNRGTKLKVDNIGQAAILVSVNGGRVMGLNRIESPSGNEYSSGTYSFSKNGGTVTWTVGRMAPESCSTVAVPR
ncbi:MliC family protein [Sphingorhabdus pulchriflava]|nr:MliC family protein [Sphingorhabdus pulchriflava]